MFDAFYSAMLALWRALLAIAVAGHLADGMPMPPALALEIKVRFPIVFALVTAGHALSGTDLAGNQDIVRQLLAQHDAFLRLARRFGVLSVLSAATTAPWTRYNSIRREIIREDPEAGALLPPLPTTGELGWGTAIAVIAIGGGLLLASKKGLL